MQKPMLIAGNWKMNGHVADLPEINAIAAAADAAPPGIEVWVAPPFTLIAAAAALAGTGRLTIGGQDCHASPSGAHTGSISAPMLADSGCAFVIAGHSERRAGCGETDADVRAKAEAARAAGLRVIVCVGETEHERDTGRARAVVGGQLAGSLPDSADGLVIAYEPVWAIGTGRTPSASDVADMHGFIRTVLAERFVAGAAVPILYGGSVKPSNAAELLGIAEVGGALVGGASLKATDFVPIIVAASA